MGCSKCSGNCSACAGCAGALELTQQEIGLLQDLGQYSFLPVARRADDLTPIWCGPDGPEGANGILQCLEKKNLITIDFDMPLRGFAGYGSYPLKGSAALTLQGQQVLDVLDVQGAL